MQRFYNKTLEDITEEELRQYWVCCQSEFGWSAATLRISYSGISHFFKKTLIRPWNIFKQIKWRREETLPTILSLQEVRKIIYALPTLQSHTFYLTLYSLGLRLREATTLQVRDILSDRGLVHIHAGKGALDRMVPLPKITLEGLRKYYLTHQNPKWIFPAMGRNGGKDARFAKDHASDSGVQGVLQSTLKRLGIKKHVHPHVFRHAYATHLLEANIPIRHVQKILGHKTLQKHHDLSACHYTGTDRLSSEGFPGDAGGVVMSPIQDIFRTYGPEYLSLYGDRMPKNHKKVMNAICENAKRAHSP